MPPDEQKAYRDSPSCGHDRPVALLRTILSGFFSATPVRPEPAAGAAIAADHRRVDIPQRDGLL